MECKITNKSETAWVQDDESVVADVKTEPELIVCPDVKKEQIMDSVYETKEEINEELSSDSKDQIKSEIKIEENSILEDSSETLCGTPNYIAPEVLMKKGHSLEVDVWSNGCIMYTLPFGKPPFGTNTLKETYAWIKKCQYHVPQGTLVSTSACKLIKEALQPELKLRPSIADILSSKFLTDDGLLNAVSSPCKETDPPNTTSTVDECRLQLKKLYEQLLKVIASKPTTRKVRLAYGKEATDPAAQPVVWISKWADYSDKYGFGYQLSDESMGVVFNDNTQLVMLSDGVNVRYITKEGDESYHTMTEFPSTLDKKMKLLTYFQRYMNEYLVTASDSVTPRESDSCSRIPYMYQWYRTSCAVIMHLNNGTLQINFSDHTKIIMCPHMSAITSIDKANKFHTYRFKSIIENGCSGALEKCIRFALDWLATMTVRTKCKELLIPELGY